MIRNNKLLPAIAILGAMSFTGCTLNKMVKLSKNQQTTVTPNPLEVHADQVKFDMSVVLPVKMLKKKTTYTTNVAYKYGEQKADVGTVQFNAADFPNAKKEQPKMDKNFSFAYTDAMKRGELVLQGTAAKGKKSKTTPEMVVAQGVITTSKLYREADLVAYAETGYNSEPEFEPTNVAFFFDQGRSVLKTSEVRSKRGKFMDNFISEKNVTKSVSITGTHSPEGAERINSKLSEERAQAIQKYYRGKMKQYDYRKRADSIEFVLKPVIEDWTQMKDTLAATDVLTQEQKDQVASIVDGPGEFEEKEGQLERLPFFNKLLKTVYPKLRTAQTEILTLMEKKPDSEISVLAKRIVEGRDSAGVLNEKEIAHAATLTPDLEEKRGIYEAAAKRYDSWQAHNDLAAVHLDMARKENDAAKKSQLVDAAITHLEMARNKQETAEVYNNLAVAYTMKGDKAKALEAINKATTMTGGEAVTRSINAAKGVMQIKNAQYSEAVATLSQAGDSVTVLYNKGLAQILAGQFDAATATLNEAATRAPNDGQIYYLSAIAAARSKNESAVLSSLTQAVQKDSNLKAKALEDLEFNAYANSEAFKNAIK